MTGCARILAVFFTLAGLASQPVVALSHSQISAARTSEPNVTQAVLQGEYEARVKQYDGAQGPLEKEIHTHAFVGLIGDCVEQATDKAGKKAFTKNYAYFRFNVGRNFAWNGGAPQAIGSYVPNVEELRKLRDVLLKNPWGLSSGKAFFVDALFKKDQEALQKEGKGYAYSQLYSAGMVNEDEALQFVSVKKDVAGKFLIEYLLQTRDKDQNTRDKVHVFCKADPKEADRLQEKEIEDRETTQLTKLLPSYAERFPPDLWKAYLYKRLLEETEGAKPDFDLDKQIAEILKEEKKQRWFPHKHEAYLRKGMAQFGRSYLFLKKKYEKNIPIEKRKELYQALTAGQALVDGVGSYSPSDYKQATPVSKNRDRRSDLDGLLYSENAKTLMRNPNPAFSEEEKKNLNQFIESTAEALKARAYLGIHATAPIEIIGDQFERPVETRQTKDQTPTAEWFYKNPKEIIYRCASTEERDRDFNCYSISFAGDKPRLIFLEDRQQATTRADYDRWIKDEKYRKTFGEMVKSLLPYLASLSGTSPPRYTGTDPHPEANAVLEKLWKQDKETVEKIVKLTPIEMVRDEAKGKDPAKAHFAAPKSGHQLTIQMTSFPASGVNAAWVVELKKKNGETLYGGVYPEEEKNR